MPPGRSLGGIFLLSLALALGAQKIVGVLQAENAGDQRIDKNKLLTYILVKYVRHLFLGGYHANQTHTSP